MLKYFFCSILFFTSLMAASQKTRTQADPRLAGLDQQLTALLDTWSVAGFAIAVVEKNKIVYSRGFGYRDLDQKKPVTANTLFQIGSCSKAFTAALLGLLEQEGKIDLDKPARQYLPALRFYNNEMDDHVSARDMMSHRTGLPRHDFSWYFFNTPARDSMLMRVQYLEPSMGLREKWQYNNFMYLAQGMMVEKMTGKTWEQNIREKFFDSLDMRRSNFSIEEMVRDEDHALGYTVEKDSLIKKTEYYDVMGISPAGSINSSVNEMANWVIGWINQGKYRERNILPAQYVRSAISSHMVISPALPDKDNPDIHFSNYGLGWFLTSYRGHYRVEHGGNITGFSASTCFFPSDSLGIIVLTNQNQSMVTTVARNLIADRMLKLKFKDWSLDRKKMMDKARADEKEAEKNKTSNRVTGTSPSHLLKEYEGFFHHPGYGTIEIFTKSDSLFGRTPKDPFWLRHFHYDVFEAKEINKESGPDTTDGGFRFNFRTNDAGKIEAILLQLEPALKPLEFVNKPMVKPQDKEELAKYEGEYELAGMTAKVYLKGNILFVFVPGQPEYETTPAGNHEFKLKALEGFSIRFELDEHSEVNAIYFIQPNGTFKANKKN